MGGQSAFGTKAGDVFTWITVGTATVWVMLAGVGGCVMRNSATEYADTFASGSESGSSEESSISAESDPLSDISGEDAASTTPVTPPDTEQPQSDSSATETDASAPETSAREFPSAAPDSPPGAEPAERDPLESDPASTAGSPTDETGVERCR